MSYKNEMENLQSVILSKDLSKIVDSLKTIPESNLEERLNIYIDGYSSRLINVLEEAYPATVKYMGTQRAAAMFKEFVENNPSKFKNIDKYALTLPPWVKGKTDEKPLLEILDYEAAINEIFFMPESKDLDANFIASLPPEKFSELIFKPRTASKLMNFEYDVESFLQQVRAGEVNIELKQKDIYIYLCRNNNSVKRNILEYSEYQMLKRLFSGLNLNAAIEEISKDEKIAGENLEQKFQAWFQKWFSEGFFAD